MTTTIKGVDQFYTQRDVAAECYAALCAHLGPRAGNAFFVEPSAGTGAFFDLLPHGRRWGGDVDPRAAGVCRADFLRDTLPDFGPRERVVVVGNPPFGKGYALAQQFVRRAGEIANTIAFILPTIFRDNGRGRSRPPPQFSQTLLRTLPATAFETRAGAPYIYRSVFIVLERTGLNPPRAPRWAYRAFPRTVRYLQWRDRARANLFVQMYGGYDVGKVFLHMQPPYVHWRTCIPLDADRPGLAALALHRGFQRTLRPASCHRQWITIQQVMDALIAAETAGVL